MMQNSGERKNWTNEIDQQLKIMDKNELKNWVHDKFPFKLQNNSTTLLRGIRPRKRHAQSRMTWKMLSPKLVSSPTCNMYTACW